MAGNFVKLVGLFLIVEYIFGAYMRVEGVWSTWHPWSHCSCSTGTKTRDRVCTSGATSACLGPSHQTESCRTHCHVEGVWSTWQPWSHCSCSTGTKTRDRVCTSGVTSACLGPSHQTESCRTHCHGSVNGGWSMWESWSQCFCDTETRTRHRECNNPAPASGGSDCVGLRSEQSSCADQCPVDGNWGTWGTWSSCMCNTGTHNRTRECNNPLPTRGGDDCVGAQYEQASCADQCPDTWIDWEPWSPCTVTCNGGYQIRQRQCTKLDNTLSGGCHGDPSQVQSCGTMDCEGPGVWVEWTQWSACSASCGSGFRYIARFCINPHTEKEKHDCLGHAVESQSCQVKQCSEATTTATTKPHVRLVPPEIFGSTEANVGGNVTLLCLTGIPGLTLTWYYQENHPLPVGASQPMGTNELIITGVDSKNYGNYTCELSDSYHTVTSRVFINFHETSPVILSLIKSPDMIVEGAPVKIKCDVLAFPEPVVRWGYKDRSGNSFVLPPVSYNEGGKEIDIDSFQSNLHGGTWTCNAINKLGSDHRDISL